MSVVDTILSEYTEINKFLDDNKQPSLSSDLNRHFKKIILLSVASYFEHEIQNILINFVSATSRNDNRLINFLKKKAISLQYHTYFSWGEKDNPDKPGNNANTFFALFGDDFKKSVSAEIQQNTKLGESIKSFLEIGHLRNILVHSNFAAYNFENKTTEDIYKSYQNASLFIDYLKDKLK